MNSFNLHSAYDFTGKTIAITGGGGVLCSAMARTVAECNANVVLLDRDTVAGEKVLATLQGTKGRHSFVAIDVLDVHIVQSAAKEVIANYGIVYGLINGAGGNSPKATTNLEQTFFDISPSGHSGSRRP